MFCSVCYCVGVSVSGEKFMIGLFCLCWWWVSWLFFYYIFIMFFVWGFNVVVYSFVECWFILVVDECVD